MKIQLLSAEQKRITGNETKITIALRFYSDAGTLYQPTSITYFNKYTYSGPDDKLVDIAMSNSGDTKYINVEITKNETKTSQDFNLSFTFAIYSGRGYYEEATTPNIHITQISTNQKPFIIEKKRVYLNYDQTEAVFNYINNVDYTPDVTKSGVEYEYIDYNEEVDYEATPNQIIITIPKQNLSNLTYNSPYKVSYQGYEDEIIVTHLPNPNAIHDLFLNINTVLRPLAGEEDLQMYRYYINLITDKPIKYVSMHWLSSINKPVVQSDLLILSTVQIDTEEKIGDNYKYTIGIYQKGIDNRSGVKKYQNVQLICEDDDENAFIVEQIVYTQESYNHVYVEPIITDYRAKEFINIPIEGDWLGNGRSYPQSITPKLPDWLTLRVDQPSRQLQINEIQENLMNYDRNYTGTISFQATGPGLITQLAVTVTQTKKPETSLFPAWKKHYISLSPDNNYFMVKINDEDVYKSEYFGNQIEIQDLVSSYINTPEINFNSFGFSRTQPTIIQVNSGDITEQTWLEHNCSTIWDYSYQDLETSSYLLTGETQPIDFVDPRQYLVCTVRNFNNQNFNGSVFEMNKNGQVIHNRNFEVVDEIESLYHYLSPIDSNATRVGFQESRILSKTYIYDVKCTNAKYCLYYLSPFGSWNWCLFEGKAVETDTVKKETYLANINNAYSTMFETNNFMETVNTGWTLNTGYIKDKYSKNFRYLVQSPKVYLHDLEENQVYAVNIETKSADVKTFKNNGRKFATYSIKVNFAQNKYIFS